MGTNFLVLIRGLPGSGKTTAARGWADFGYDHHEADQYFEHHGEYRFDKDSLADAHAWCLSKTKRSMRHQQNCVVSNTFSQLWEMQPYIDLAKHFHYKLEIVEAKGLWPSIHNVPQEVIDRMRARWEVVES